MNARSAWLRVASDHPALAGHFPGFPVVPGVVLLDEALHAIESAGQAEPAAAPADTAGSSPASLWHIGTVKFHRAVRPGELLQLEYESQPDGRARFELRAADALVAQAAVREPHLFA